MDANESEVTANRSRAARARKIQIDSSIYRLHSVRASGGDEHCDHDFDSEPMLDRGSSAVWQCNCCGRKFTFERWQ